MILKSTRIKHFKCITDSEEFSIGGVTCLVGKNESGKTAILEALYKLKPDIQSNNMFIDLEYPRSKWEPSMKGVDLPKDVLETEWDLTENDRAYIQEHFGFELAISDEVKVKKGYDNIQRYTYNVKEKPYLDHLIKTQKFSAPELNSIKSASSVNELVEKLIELGNDRTDKHESLLKNLRETLIEEDFSKTILSLLEERIPTFLYFNDYYLLPGRVSLTEYIKKQNNDTLSQGDRVFSALLELVGTTPQELNEIDTIARLDASLEAVSNSLTAKIFEYWSQNKHLEVNFSFDHARSEDPAPFNQGYIFRTKIRNNRHKSSVNFDDRSSGFVWFFSFLIWFSQVKDNYGDNIIILLDEPGLNLHATAQNDLLRYINEKLKPNYQVVYTTHSPFMIDSNNLSETRTVEDTVEWDSQNKREILLGTKVSEEVLSVDRDTLLPLQGALGYDITQTLFIGKNNLLVEGPSDLLYLKWFSKKLSDIGRTGLSEKWTICPVGGIDKVAGFISLFSGSNLHLSVLVDLHQGQKGKIEKIKQNSIFKSGNVFTPDMYLALDEGDIEDLVGLENYRHLINSCYSLDADNKLGALDDSSIIMPQVEAHMRTVTQDGVPPFDHYTPSLFLIENGNKLEKGFTKLEEALNKFESLFEDLNNSLKD